MLFSSNIPPTSLKKITLSGDISLAKAKVALSALILTTWPSEVLPTGAITGTPLFRIISFILSENVSTTSPTYPRDLFATLHSKISPTKETALTPSSFNASVSFKFSLVNIETATSKTSSVVTLWPSTKENSIPCSSSSFESIGPAP